MAEEESHVYAAWLRLYQAHARHERQPLEDALTALTRATIAYTLTSPGKPLAEIDQEVQDQRFLAMQACADALAKAPAALRVTDGETA